MTVDVLETAYDPDGKAEDLRVAKVFTPPGVESSIDGSSVTVVRGEQPRVYPFRVVDGDGGASTASLYVPPIDAGRAVREAGRADRGRPGRLGERELADLVVNPAAARSASR